MKKFVLSKALLFMSGVYGAWAGMTLYNKVPVFTEMTCSIALAIAAVATTDWYANVKNSK